MTDKFESAHPRSDAGRFCETAKVDPGAAVIADDWRTITSVLTVDEQDDDGLSSHTEETVRGDAEFQRRCRRILGVTDDSLPVTVVHSESESNPWGCETFESVEDVIVSCGGHQLVAKDMPELFRRLDAADLPRMDADAARELLMAGSTVTVLIHDGRRRTGKVANCNSWQVVVDDGARDVSRFDFTEIIGYEEQK